MKKPLAEFIGTFAPVLFVCGATVIAGGGGDIGRTFTLSGEIGAIGMGGLNVSVDAPAIAANEVAAEVNNINDELSAFGVYPYVAITGTFRF